MQKYKVGITKSAEGDIKKIFAYIAEGSRDEAIKWVKEIRRQIDSLENFPLRCPIIPESHLLGEGYRHLLYGNYRTIFMVDKTNVIILRVIHGARLLDLWMFEK